MLENKRVKKAIGNNYRPLCFIKNQLLVYRKEKLFLMDITGDKVDELCDFPIIDPRRRFCFCDFGERLSHIYAYCGMEVPGGAVVAFNRGIYFVDAEKRTVTREHDFSIPDMRRPLNFYKIEGVIGFDDMVVYADYSFNAQRKAMNIWGRTGEGEWKIVYTFPAGTIRHVHSIVSDPYRDRVIVLTGDFGDECGIWEVKDNFSSVTCIAGSEQKYRACCARAYPEGLAIVTDSPFDQNYVYLVFDDKNGKPKIKEIARIPGPTVFFSYYKDDMVFATDVEYDEATVKGFYQYFTYRRGPGVQDWYSHLYIGNPKKGFREIIKFKKDIFPMVSLGFGQVAFPTGQVDGRIFLYPTAVKKYNQKLCVLKENGGNWYFESH